jgi:hypothetical protein
LNFAVGNLSAEVAIGGPATGESFAAASPSGRPIKGEPGGSAGAAAGAAAGEVVAGCCAAAPNVNAPKKTPASNSLRDADKQIVIVFSPMWKPVNPGASERDAGADCFQTATLRHFSVPAQSENIFAEGADEKTTEGAAVADVAHRRHGRRSKIR